MTCRTLWASIGSSAIRYHMNTVYVIAVMTSFNCGEDVICLRAVKPDSTGQHARTYPSQEDCIAALDRLRPRLNSTQGANWICDAYLRAPLSHTTPRGLTFKVP